MPVCKQIEAALVAWFDNEASWDRGMTPEFREKMKDSMRAALTAAEQAEPAPAARSGAVKVTAEDVANAMLDAWNEICDDTNCHPLDIEQHGRRKLTFTPNHWARLTALYLAALEPAEPATDAEPASVIEYVLRFGGRCRDCADTYGICENRYLPCDPSEARRAVSHVISALKYGVDRGYIASPFPHPPESRLREALEWLLAPFSDDPCRLDHHGYCQAHFLELHCCVAKARAALAQEDGR